MTLSPTPPRAIAFPLMYAPTDARSNRRRFLTRVACRAPDKPRSTRQCGQALAEALVIMVALAALWAAIHWLAHYQDMALSGMHASRHAAFLATRTGAESVDTETVRRFFSGEAYRWTDRRGSPLLDPDTGVHLGLQRLSPVSSLAQPGAGAAHVTTLRREWSLADAGPVRARVSLTFPRVAPAAGGPLGLDAFDLAYPPLVRSTSILLDAGHAVSDAHAQARAAASPLAWESAYVASNQAGRAASHRSAGVDEAWGRHGPTFDWFQPWTGRVPIHLIEDKQGE